MTAIAPTWTTERIEQLKQGYEAGLSCREIAAEIGVSRNAVIGKLSRLNLTREGSGDAAQSPRKASPKPRARATARVQLKLLQSAFGGAEPYADDAPIPNGHTCTLFELSEKRCRWPIGTPDDADFCFCGNNPIKGLPYCTGHARLAYQVGSRERRAGG